jgi:hypothetical protein
MVLYYYPHPMISLTYDITILFSLPVAQDRISGDNARLGACSGPGCHQRRLVRFPEDIELKK